MGKLFPSGGYCAGADAGIPERGKGLYTLIAFHAIGWMASTAGTRF